VQLEEQLEYKKLLRGKQVGITFFKIIKKDEKEFSTTCSSARSKKEENADESMIKRKNLKKIKATFMFIAATCFHIHDRCFWVLFVTENLGPEDCAGRVGQRRSMEGTTGHFELLSSAIFKREGFLLRTIWIMRTIVW